MKNVKGVIVLIASVVLLVLSSDLSFASNRKKDKKKHEKKPAASQDKQEKQEADSDYVYMTVDEMPEFPGGVNALRSFLSQHVRYPIEAQKNDIQGKVFVTFVVEKDGSIKMPKVVQSVDPFLDKEALRVVKLMPKWVPGKYKGNIVSSNFTLPINFRLK